MLNSKKCTKRIRFEYVKIIYYIGEYMVKNSCQGDEFYVKGKMSKFVHIIAIIDLRAKILQWAKYTKMGLLIVHCNKKSQRIT